MACMSYGDSGGDTRRRRYLIERDRGGVVEEPGLRPEKRSMAAALAVYDVASCRSREE